MSDNKNKQQGRSVVGTLIGLIVVILAVVLTQLTGVDFIGLLEDTQNEVAIEQPANIPGEVTPLRVEQGYGAQKGFWSVYFNAPTGSSDRSTYTASIDVPLANAIGRTRRTLDIAAFEFNNERLTDAVLDAHRRGVQVRIVTDDEHGLEDEESSIQQFIDAGIPVVDDDRTGLMHNKFMILDSTTVWTGSWNYTVNGTYRNNNNALVLRAQRAVQAYQSEFNEMFEGREFGITSPSGTARFRQEGTPVQIYFAAEDDVNAAILREIDDAQDSIRFMSFSFTRDDIGEAMREKAANGVTVSGLFEVLGSETRFSELTPMFCAGLDVRQDGNPYRLHHKVIIVDNDTVITGSFNFSDNATQSNDENLVIIEDPDLAGMYIQEYNRMFKNSVIPDDLECN